MIPEGYNLLAVQEKELFDLFEPFAKGEAEATSEDQTEIASETWYLQKVMYEGWKVGAAKMITDINLKNNPTT